jgi:hypothetical protein
MTAEDVLGENQREGRQPSTSRGLQQRKYSVRRIKRRKKKGYKTS